MATLADNHLSKYGRSHPLGGPRDDKMYTTTKGEKWHVNRGEKEYMEETGEVGEKLIDMLGSGTINPHTGYEEKQLDPVSTTMAGITLVNEFFGGKEASKGAGRQASATRQSIQDIENLDDTLDTSFAEQGAALGVQKGLDIRRIHSPIGESLGKVKESSETAAGKSRMAFSGTVEKKKESMLGMISQKLTGAMEDVSAGFAEKKGKLKGWYEGQKSKNKAEVRRLRNLEKEYTAQANAPKMHNLWGLIK